MDLKEKVLIRRNEKGETIPIETEIILDGEKYTALIKPIPIGVASEFSRFKDENSPEAIEAAANMISQYFVEPKFTTTEVKDLKFGYAPTLINKLLEVSGYQKKAL